MAAIGTRRGEHQAREINGHPESGRWERAVGRATRKDLRGIHGHRRHRASIFVSLSFVRAKQYFGRVFNRIPSRLKGVSVGNKQPRSSHPDRFEEWTGRSLSIVGNGA